MDLTLFDLLYPEMDAGSTAIFMLLIDRVFFRFSPIEQSSFNIQWMGKKGIGHRELK